jgi:hypothetical protein
MHTQLLQDITHNTNTIKNMKNKEKTGNKQGPGKHSQA